MLPATSPTLVDSRIAVSPGFFQGAPVALRAAEGGDGAPFGEFGAMLGTITESFLDNGAKTQVPIETDGANGMDPSDGASGESQDGVMVFGEAQETADNAQGLPVVEADDGSFVLHQMESSPPDDDDRAKEERAGHRVKSGGVAMDDGGRSREAASGVVAVRPAWGELPRELSPNEGHVRERSQEGAPPRPAPVEAREPNVASRAAQGNRDDARNAAEQVHVRNEATSSRQNTDAHHRVQTVANQASEHRGQDDAGARSDRESPRRDQPLPRERSGSLPPAAARAEQVNAAVRLEQATGQEANPAPPESPRSPESPESPKSSEPQRPPASTASTASTGSTASPAPPSIESALRHAPAIDAQPGANQQNHAQSNATSAPDAPRAEESPLTSRMVRGLTAMVNQRGGSLTMRLDPPELGSMRVQMTINRGTVVAKIVASTAQAHGLLQKNLAMLRTALESHGLSVERLTVQLAPSNQSPLNSQHQQQDGSGRPAQQDAHADAGEGQSRGRRDHDGRAGANGHGGDGEGEREHFSRFIQHEAVPVGATTR